MIKEFLFSIVVAFILYKVWDMVGLPRITEIFSKEWVFQGFLMACAINLMMRLVGL